ncbi:hypothetical protein HDU88_007099 [Geranomyces variabilis]|nr:hypothetical protein HDU88_007099 [Geranomyces variabilis]
MAPNKKPTPAHHGLWPQKSFIVHGQAGQLQRLWELERLRIQGLPLPAAGTGAAPAAATGAAAVPAVGAPAPAADPVVQPLPGPVPRGREPFKSQTKLKTRQAFAMPILYPDGLWLLDAWLDDAYESGGTFTVASPDEYPNHDCITVLFGSFLDSHQNHPFCEYWRAYLANLHEYGKHITANIRFLRPVTKQITLQATTAAKKARKAPQRQLMTVGPQGTAWCLTQGTAWWHNLQVVVVQLTCIKKLLLVTSQ